MSNAIVDDCSATFFDSDGNLATLGDYAHNENRTFTICVPGADSIILTFDTICTEAGRDILRFFDGPDTLSPMIGLPTSGTGVNPGAIIASSGCLTIHFQSDASVSCSGWEGQWQAIITTPVAPTVSPIPNPPCSTNSITIMLDQQVLCDSLSPSNITFFGPMTPTATAVTPIGCVGGLTNTIQVTFSPQITINGAYSFQLTTYFLDACDSLWQLNTFGNFMVVDCPLEVEIVTTDSTLCAGKCTPIFANVIGGTPGTYNYTWSPPLPNSPGPHNVCPASTLVYSVTVFDASPASPGLDYITITVTPLPSMPNDTTVCQTDPSFSLNATPSGGVWGGRGVTMSGTFRPWAAGGGGVKDIYYTVNGCSDTMQITINPAFAGWTTAACANSAPFLLSGSENPIGGFWRGTGIVDSVTGMFDPTIAGVGLPHVIEYTVPGCPNARRNVYVDTLEVQDDTSVCLNTPEFRLTFAPLGGRWSGPGIDNSFWGDFIAADAGIGTHRLIYTMNGCSDTVFVTVIDIDAGDNRNACPTGGEMDTLSLLSTISPLGGFWTGDGIIDTTLGIYDASLAPSWSYIYYTAGGCVDTMNVWNVPTFINVDPLPNHCPNDTVVSLNYDNTDRGPWGGSWSGTGTLPGLGPVGAFNPSIAGGGTHTLYYTHNGCVDSTHITVYPDSDLRDTTVCQVQAAFVIPNGAPGGNWFGTGILNPVTGLFDAATAGIGIHTLIYQSPSNCLDTMQITVTAVPVVTITGLSTNYCFVDSSVTLNAMPAGGVWTGTALLPGNVFNPSIHGSGIHSFTYTVGSGDCAVSRTVNTQVSNPIVINAAFIDTTICENGAIRISASATGGINNSYNFVWDNGLGNGTSHLVSPTGTTTYTVYADEGCSTPDTAQITVRIATPFTVSFVTDTTKCFGNPSFVEADIMPIGSYSFEWDTDPVQTTNRINALAGSFYSVEVIDNSTGCSQNASIEAPAHEQIQANFITAPNENCATLINPAFQYLDLSIGGVTGFWNFGDGGFEEYDPSINPEHTYGDTGTYLVTLIIENDGGCQARHYEEVCVEPASVIYIPNSFTPNGDGLNEYFRAHGVGLTDDFEMLIFNRWGQQIFESNDIQDGWDGQFLDEPVQVGGYPYVITFRNLLTNRKEQHRGMIVLTR